MTIGNYKSFLFFPDFRKPRITEIVRQKQNQKFHSTELEEFFYVNKKTQN